MTALIIASTTAVTAYGDETADPVQQAPSAQNDPQPEPEVHPFVPIATGERSNRVRKLQSRLHQLGLHSEIITWRYDAETRRAVAAFKKTHQLSGGGRGANERGRPCSP